MIHIRTPCRVLRRRFAAFALLWILAQLLGLSPCKGFSASGDDTPLPDVPAVEQSVKPNEASTAPVFSASQYQLFPLSQAPQDFSPLPQPIWSTSNATFRLRGRIDYDMLSVSQSAKNQAAFGDLPDTAGLRRARIGAEGHFSDDARYLAELDFASGQVVIRDLFAGVGDVADAGELKFGHMREPFSLEGGTSANTFAFMERSPINDLDPARNWGVGFTKSGPNDDSTFSCGIFQSGMGPNDFGIVDGSETSVTGRWTRLLRYEDEGRRFIHFGFATSSRIPDRQVVVINLRPSSPLLDLSDSSASAFVPKVAIPASYQQLFNAQWACNNGSFWSQAEWNGSVIHSLDGQTIFLHGTYLAAGYFLTGEHRDYQKQSGINGPIKVARPFLSGFSSTSIERPPGYGAWEVAARVSYLDFSDTANVTSQQIVGTRLPQATIGVNWYLADRFRLMFNYYHSMPDLTTTGNSTASVFATRVAMFW